MLARASVQLKNAGRRCATAIGPSRLRGASRPAASDDVSLPLEPPWIVENDPAGWFVAVARHERWPTGSIARWRETLQRLAVSRVNFGRSPAGDVISLDADAWTQIDKTAIDPLYDALSRAAVKRTLNQAPRREDGGEGLGQ